eukprot:9479482-Pyramimonas_sp.AAC.1
MAVIVIMSTNHDLDPVPTGTARSSTGSIRQSSSSCQSIKHVIVVNNIHLSSSQHQWSSTSIGIHRRRSAHLQQYHHHQHRHHHTCAMCLVVSSPRCYDAVKSSPLAGIGELENSVTRASYYAF